LWESDVIFLDINMPEKNGLELAEKMLEVNPNLEIVFVTAYNEYAVQAFELNAIDYVLKPAQLERLEKTFARLQSNKDQREKTLTEMSKLRVYVCGDLSFASENNSKESLQWRTAKSQELFLYLFYNVGKTVRKSELIELLWPEFKQESAYSQLYTALYNVRKTLSAFNGHFTIKSDQIGYRLNMKNVLIDIKEWESKILSAPVIHSETMDYYKKIMELYTDSYLKNYDYVWAEPERFRLEQLWVETAKKMADCYVEFNNKEIAIMWYTKICNIRPENEDANFTLMKLYAEIGYGLFVSHQYNQLEEAVKELDLDISPKIKQWHENWRKNK